MRVSQWNFGNRSSTLSFFTVSVSISKLGASLKLKILTYRRHPRLTELDPIGCDTPASLLIRRAAGGGSCHIQSKCKSSLLS
jgi:hypothetical protein